MGIFTGIGMITPDATRYKKHVRSLENMQARRMIVSAKHAIEQFNVEKPRQQAHLKQTMFARGLGKSTIFDQDKARLDMIQAHRDEQLRRALRYAKKYKTMIDRKHHWEKVSQYYEAIDGIIGFVGGGSSSASMDYSAQEAGAYAG